MTPKHSEHRPKTHHHTHLGALGLKGNPVSRRRSNRMGLNASVGVSGEDRLKCPFTMPAKATNLNRHGAAVHLARDLVVGSIVTIKNQRGAQVSARVVAQLAAMQGISTYGLEFVDQDEKAHNFWGITFPSSNA